MELIGKPAFTKRLPYTKPVFTFLESLSMGPWTRKHRHQGHIAKPGRLTSEASALSGCPQDLEGLSGVGGG